MATKYDAIDCLTRIATTERFVLKCLDTTQFSQLTFFLP